jgi:hypothetical protein
MRPLRFNFDSLASAMDFLARAEPDNPELEFHPPMAKTARGGAVEWEVLAVSDQEAPTRQN